jgi:hypothetical protein
VTVVIPSHVPVISQLKVAAAQSMLDVVSPPLMTAVTSATCRMSGSRFAAVEESRPSAS